jgi:glycosyltransferase involved in cell wall biosynthesis
MTPEMTPVILVAGRHPSAERGGHSSYVRTHAFAARAAGFTPHLFCVGDRTETTEEAFGVVHRVRSPFRPVRQKMIAAHAPRLVSAVAEFAGRLPSETRVLIHSFGVWGYAGVRAAAELRRRGRSARTLQSSYTTYTDEARAKLDGARFRGSPLHAALFHAEHVWAGLVVERWERVAYERSNLILCNYHSVVRLIERRFPLHAPVRLASCSPEASFLADASSGCPDAGRAPGSNAPLIVCVSRHDPRKGNDVLLRALASLRGKGVRFRAVLLGEGPLLGSSRRLAAQLDLRNIVAIPGAVESVEPYLRAADLYVLPSRSEQSGSLAVLEAMRVGRAIVASACDGIPEDLTDGVDALLTPPGDAAALAERLRRLLGDSALRQRLGAEARATFDRRFSPAGFVADLAAVYGSLGLRSAAAGDA